MYPFGIAADGVANIYVVDTNNYRIQKFATTLTTTKIGIYNAGNWYIDYNGDGQFIPATGDRYIPYGASGWTHLVGDWNGDGKSEIGIYKDGLWDIDYGGSGVIDANTKYYSFGGAGGHRLSETGTLIIKMRSGFIMPVTGISTMTVTGSGVPETKTMVSVQPGGQR